MFCVLQAAEAGNLDDFKRLYMADTTRLSLQDGKGRTAAHQAAARNRVNILRYIRDQNGGKHEFVLNFNIFYFFMFIPHRFQYQR